MQCKSWYQKYTIFIDISCLAQHWYISLHLWAYISNGTEEWNVEEDETNKKWKQKRGIEIEREEGGKEEMGITL